jgi:hypothetical protein
MVNRSQDFRASHINHVASALKAAVDAGVTNPQVHVRLPSGAELRVGAGDRPVAPAPRSPVAPVARKSVAVAPLKPPRGIRPRGDFR